MAVSTESGLKIRTEQNGAIVHLTLNRPESRNALSRALLTELAIVLDQIAQNESARVVIIAAEGNAFCAGHDLKELSNLSPDVLSTLFEECTQVMLRLRMLPLPVIARVQGAAFAAGCQLVASCDLAVAADSATFAAPGVKIGLFCSTPMVPLVRVAPPRAALEMLLTGEPISAERALSIGLLNRVVPVEELDAAVAGLADPIIASSRAVIGLGKAAFYQQLALSESDAYMKACKLMSFNAHQPDAREGISAFLQKRRPKWIQTQFND
jgi:enoyl-CoA hydratase/carnithine racemase